MSSARPCDHYITVSPGDRRKSQHSLEDPFSSLKNDGGKKRVRTLLRPEQTMVLNKILEQTCFPSTSVREAAARELGISPRKVQVWFQNVRQKHKRLGAGTLTNSGRRYHSSPGGEEDQPQPPQSQQQQQSHQHPHPHPHNVTAITGIEDASARSPSALSPLPQLRRMGRHAAPSTRDAAPSFPSSVAQGRQLNDIFASTNHHRFQCDTTDEARQQQIHPRRPDVHHHRPDDFQGQREGAYSWHPSILPTHHSLSQALQDKLAIHPPAPPPRNRQTGEEENAAAKSSTAEAGNIIKDSTALRAQCDHPSAMSDAAQRNEAPAAGRPWHGSSASDAQSHRRPALDGVLSDHSPSDQSDGRGQYDLTSRVNNTSGTSGIQTSVAAPTTSGPRVVDWSSYKFPTGQSVVERADQSKAIANSDEMQSSALTLGVTTAEYSPQSGPTLPLLGSRRTGLTSYPPFAFPPDQKRRAADSLVSLPSPWSPDDSHPRGYVTRPRQRVSSRPTSRSGMMKSHSLNGSLPHSFMRGGLMASTSITERRYPGSLASNKGPMWTQHLSHIHADTFARRKSDGSGDSLPLCLSTSPRPRPSTSASPRTSLASFRSSPLPSQSSRTSSIMTSSTREQERDSGTWPSHYRGESFCSILSSSTRAGTGAGSLESSCGSFASPTGETDSPGGGQSEGRGGGAYSKTHEGYFMHRPLAGRVPTESSNSSIPARGVLSQYYPTVARDSAMLSTVSNKREAGIPSSDAATSVPRPTQLCKTHSQNVIKFLGGQCGATTAFGKDLAILQLHSTSAPLQGEEAVMEVLKDIADDDENNSSGEEEERKGQKQEQEQETEQLNRRTGTELCRRQLWSSENHWDFQQQQEVPQVCNEEEEEEARPDEGTMTLPPIQSILASSGYATSTASLAWDMHEAKEDQDRDRDAKLRFKGRAGRLPGIAELAGAGSLWSVRSGSGGRER